MAEQTIVCPNCRKRIPLSKALTGQIEEKLRGDFEVEFRKREQEARVSYERKLTAELARLEKRAKKEAETAAARELASLRKQIAEAQKREQTAQAAYKRKLTAEVARLEQQARKEAEEATASELANLRKQLRDKDKRLEEIRKQEQELHKLQSELEAREKSIESEITRKLEKERRKVEEKVTEKLTEEYQAKEQEDAKRLSELRKQVVELKLKLEQSSQQRQGEVGEEEIEDTLKKNFPCDQIEPVGKGKTGADVLQRVCTQSGQCCGTIVWESKRAKAWSKGWLSKLRSDQRQEKAELAVLVSTALPKDVSYFAQIEGVWVTDFPLVVGVATALRSELIQVMIAKGSAVGKNIEVKELLYDYLTGTEFKQRVEAIIESFRSMQDDLEKEKQAIERNWARREKQIQVVVENVAGMYGDMQGLGATLPRIRRLELLPAPQEGSLPLECW